MTLRRMARRRVGCARHTASTAPGPAAPAPLRRHARADACRGLPAFASLSMAGSERPDPTDSSTASSSRTVPHASAPRGTPRASKPYLAGMPWRNRRPNASTTRKCSGSLLPSSPPASDGPLPAPRTLQTTHTPLRPPPTGLPRPRPSPSAPSRGPRGACHAPPGHATFAPLQPPVGLNFLSPDQQPRP